MSFLKRIQEKDSAAKAQFSLLASGVVTGLIALVWVSTLPARIGNTISLDGKEHTEEQDSKGLGSIFGEAKNQLGSLADWKKQLEEESSPQPDSAMGSLMNETQEENTPPPALDTLSPATTSEAVLPPVESAPTPVATSTSEAAPPEPVPLPKMILIGTTTSPKP